MGRCSNTCASLSLMFARQMMILTFNLFPKLLQFIITIVTLHPFLGPGHPPVPLPFNFVNCYCLPLPHIQQHYCFFSTFTLSFHQSVSIGNFPLATSSSSLHHSIGNVLPIQPSKILQPSFPGFPIDRCSVGLYFQICLPSLESDILSKCSFLHCL